MDSTYSPGTVSSDNKTTFLVTLDSGDQIEYSYEDITAVVSDTTPAWLSLGDHVIALSPMANASEQYHIGFVSRDYCEGGVNELYEVTLDKGHKVGNYTLDKLRKLPFVSSIRQGELHLNSVYNVLTDLSDYVVSTLILYQDDQLSKRHVYTL